VPQHPAYQSPATEYHLFLPARIVRVLNGPGERKRALASGRGENTAASRISQAEIDGKPVFGVEGTHVMDAAENLSAEGTDVCIC
jgi:hypothetical protein